MHEGLNDLERSLRELQPVAAETGPILYEAGRAAGAKAARLWRGVSLGTSLGGFVGMAILGGLLAFRPTPRETVRIVQVPIVQDREPAFPEEEPIEPAAPVEESLPEWRMRNYPTRARLEPEPDGKDVPAISFPEHPLGVGDLRKGALVWSTISTVGER
jgi:hypothetical protein